MKLTLNRRPSVGGATIGELLADGKPLCYTLVPLDDKRPEWQGSTSADDDFAD
jgi:hypothetical protein